ncbi:ROK family transcriptional regulator [Kribbella sp. NPDC026611]|uniref:ROK family transcriptional regulator n=1 Tax=Kribbella sp. NPDC026611 TaxID=3154911 RepID=UPI0033CA6FEF
MTPAKPSLDLLRSLTDEHVLRALMAERRLTRAEIAVRTGLSKPAVSDSVQRLTEAGLLRDTGERTTGRGRVGTYFAFGNDLGAALVLSVAPEGVVAEAVDVYGETVARETAPVRRPARPREVGQVMRTVATRVSEHCSGRLRLAVVSAADPVDRSTGRLVHLPGAPFLLGELSPVELLGPLVSGAVTVDNDVHWAARAELAAAGGDHPADFVYLYLGEGLGAAVVADGEVRRGHTGIAGEIAYVVTRGPRGRAITYTEVFAELDLRQPDSTAIDSLALARVIEVPRAKARRVLAVLADATAGVIAAVTALTDPALVVLGGPWGTHPALVDAVARRVGEVTPREIPVRVAQLTHEPALTGARHHALDDLRSLVLAHA